MYIHARMNSIIVHYRCEHPGLTERLSCRSYSAMLFGLTRRTERACTWVAEVRRSYDHTTDINDNSYSNGFHCKQFECMNGNREAIYIQVPVLSSDQILCDRSCKTTICAWWFAATSVWGQGSTSHLPETTKTSCAPYSPHQVLEFFKFVVRIHTYIHTYTFCHRLWWGW